MNRANSCSLLSSQDIISPYNIDRISNRLVMRTENYRVVIPMSNSLSLHHRNYVADRREDYNEVKGLYN